MEEKTRDSSNEEEQSVKMDISYENLNLEEINMDLPEMVSYKDGLMNGDLDILLVFTPGFETSVISYSDGKHPNIDVYYNPAEEFSQGQCLDLNTVYYQIIRTSY